MQSEILEHTERSAVVSTSVAQLSPDSHAAVQISHCHDAIQGDLVDSLIYPSSTDFTDRNFLGAKTDQA